MMSTDNAAAVSRRTSMPAAVHGRAIGFPAFDPSFKPMIALCAVVLVVTACKTTGSTPGPDSYNMFFSPADHLTELTAAGKIDEAGKVYEAQREYFTPDSKKRAAVVGEYWNALRARLDPRIDAASRRLGTLSWPVSVDRWAEARETLSATRQVIEAIEANLIVAEKRFPFHALKDLKTALSATETTIHDDASTQLAKYDLTGSADFFATYPAAVNARSVFSTAAEALVDRFADATREDLVRIHETYRQALTESLNRALGKRYFDLARENRGGTGGRDLKTIVSAALETRAAGLPLDRIDGVKLGMIEITSETLLREGQIDYPISIEIDLPFDAEKAELDAAFTGDQAQAADHLFVVDVALAKASRRVLGIDKTPSTILSHYREDPNPQYNLVQNEVNNARMTAQQSAFATTAAANQFCQGMACIGRLVAVYAAKARQDEAEAALQAAMTKLGQTSQTVKTPVFRDYAFDVANIKTNKTTTVNYYIIDRVRKNTSNRPSI